MAKPNIDTLTLRGRHCLILGHKPENLEVSRVFDRLEQEGNDTEKWGLFDTSTPNYITYYPDLKVEDLKPKDDEFVYPIYRMLSATTVAKNYNPVDFSKPGILKESMDLLVGATVNVDHETAVGNAIGTVKEVYWQNSYKTKEGKVVPAGINAVLKIDGKSNPRLARGIMMDPPSIHSNSVTVQFAWEKSHPKMDDKEFRMRLGEMDEKGELIRRVASKIMLYFETSLVGHGADPFAQKIAGDGKIVNPKLATTRQGFSETIPKESNYIYDWKTQEDVLSFNHENKPINIISNTEDMELKDLLIELGFTAEDNITTAVEANTFIAGLRLKVTESATLQASIDDLTTKNNGLTKQVSDKDAELAKFTKTGPVGEKYITDLKAKVINSYKLLMGDKVDAKQVENLTAMEDIPTLEMLNSTYENSFNEKFPLKCKCGSTELSRKSSTSQEKTEDVEIKSNTETRNEILKKYSTIQ